MPVELWWRKVDDKFYTLHAGKLDDVPLAQLVLSGSGKSWELTIWLEGLFGSITKYGPLDKQQIRCESLISQWFKLANLPR